MSPIRILLADDNDEILAEVRELLEKDFEIIGTVTNGQDAVEAVRLFNPDVVVLDIAMPCRSPKVWPTLKSPRYSGAS